MPIIGGGLYWKLNRQLQSSVVPDKNIQRNQCLLKKITFEAVVNVENGFIVGTGFFISAFQSDPISSKSVSLWLILVPLCTLSVFEPLYFLKGAL